MRHLLHLLKGALWGLLLFAAALRLAAWLVAPALPVLVALLLVISLLQWLLLRRQD